MATVKVEIVRTYNATPILSREAVRLVAVTCGYAVDQIETLMWSAYNGSSSDQRLLRDLIIQTEQSE